MKKLLARSLIFLIPLLVFFIYLEVNLYKIQNSYSYKRQCFEQQLDSIEVLVLGSSQVVYGVNPTFFSLHGYNLSNVSQTLYYDTHLTKRYLNRMPRLKYVIINISYFSFGEQLIDGREAWRDYYYSQYWDMNFPEMEYLDSKRFSKTFLYTPLRSLSYLLDGFQVNLIKNYEPSGYARIETTEHTQSDSTGYLRVRTHEDCFQERRVEENQRDVEELIRVLQARNITPGIITPPVYATYAKFINSKKMQQNYDRIQSMFSSYNCKYFNYFRDSRFTFDDFCDNDHLNSTGAEKFSRVLNREILGGQ
ncbi:MAG: hypothetical protein IPM69_13660 [Ignavibacteria bacterium]|nr:hypothetical protein [Ignavibacteria bacterium]